VLARARAHLERLEAGAEPAASPQLSLFGASSAGSKQSPAAAVEDRDAEHDRLRELLDAVDPDELSPREALDFVYRLIQASQTDDGAD